MRILLIATFVPNEFQLFNDFLIYFLAELCPIERILFSLVVELYCAITEEENTIYGIFIKFNFMAMIAVASMLILTLTGLDRLVPLFGLPHEPQLQLKKNANKAA